MEELFVQFESEIERMENFINLFKGENEHE
jgi:hypothetical protein